MPNSPRAREVMTDMRSAARRLPRTALGPSADSDKRLAEAKRPMEEVLIRLPLLAVGPSGELDLLQSPPGLLLDLVEHAEAGAGALNMGIAAVGALMAHAAAPIEDGSISAETIEALGFMLAELGGMAAYCQVLAAKCRRAHARMQS